MADRSTILIFTQPMDIHADVVLKALEKRGRNVIRLHPEDMLNNWRLALSSGHQGEQAILLEDSNRAFQLSSVGAAWYRKPQPPNASNKYQQEVADFLRDEASAARDALYQLLSGFWWNDPYILRRYSQKMIQLQIAHHVGLRTPRTLLTNSMNDAVSFAKSCRSGVIVKTLSGVSGAVEGQQYTCFSRLIDPDDFEQTARGVNLCPVLLQEFIPKNRDIRVNVIDNTVYATAIESQSIPETRTDWRTVTPDHLPHSNYSLPSDIAAQLLAFQRKVQLPFGAVDLVEGVNGDIWFLENNLNGQWYWIEQMTGCPISHSIANSICDFLDRNCGL